MKKYLGSILAFAIVAFCFPFARGGAITAAMEGNPVIIISTATAFGVAHASEPFSSIALSKDGQPYVSPGSPQWVRYTNSTTGAVVEEHGSNFTRNRHDTLANERWLATPWRQFPPESVDVIDVVTNGQPVTVLSRVLGSAVAARVVAVNYADDYLVLDYPALDGDSASKVITSRGTVGLISKTIKEQGQPPTGSVCIVPGIDKALAGTRPAPIPTQTPPATGTTTGPAPVVPVTPPPAIPIITPDQAYRNGLKDGRAQVISEFLDFIKTR